MPLDRIQRQRLIGEIEESKKKMEDREENDLIILKLMFIIEGIVTFLLGIAVGIYFRP
jgi:hypothetical protein